MLKLMLINLRLINIDNGDSFGLGGYPSIYLICIKWMLKSLQLVNIIFII